MPEANGPLPLQDLESLLHQTLGPSLKVQSVEWKHLTDPGENFGSLILSINAKVILNGKPDTLHLVSKMPPSSAYLLDLFNSPMVFKKEIYFYKTIASSFLQFQLECGFRADQLIKLVPRFYGGRLSLTGDETFDGQAGIILENLNYSGYSVLDRLVGMDREHMEYTVKELAKLHAICIGYKIKKPNEFKELILPGLVQPSNDVAVDCINEMVNKAAENLKKMDEAKPYVERINKTLQYGDAVTARNEPVDETWGTFVHSDFWVNNMMYRHDNSGKITGMKMVDFQLSTYDYGTHDLIFFLLSSAKRDVIDDHLHDLIASYFEALVDCLRSLKVDVKEYTRENFDKLIRSSAPIRFAQCIMMVQVIKAQRGSAPDVNNVKNQDVFLSIGKGRSYDDKLLHILQTYAKNDWLVR